MKKRSRVVSPPFDTIALGRPPKLTITSPLGKKAAIATAELKDGSLVVGGYESGQIVRVSATNGAVLSTMKSEDEESIFDLIPFEYNSALLNDYKDDQTLFVSAGSKAVKVWSGEKRKCVLALSVPSQNPTHQVYRRYDRVIQSKRDPDVLIACSATSAVGDNARLCAWRISNGNTPFRLIMRPIVDSQESMDVPCNEVLELHNGDLLTLEEKTRSLILWSWKRPQQDQQQQSELEFVKKFRFNLRHFDGYIRRDCVAQLPNGNLALADDEGTLSVYSLENGEEIKRMGGANEDPVEHVIGYPGSFGSNLGFICLRPREIMLFNQNAGQLGCEKVTGMVDRLKFLRDGSVAYINTKRSGSPPWLNVRAILDRKKSLKEMCCYQIAKKCFPDLNYRNRLQQTLKPDLFQHIVLYYESCISPLPDSATTSMITTTTTSATTTTAPTTNNKRGAAATKPKQPSKRSKAFAR